MGEWQPIETAPKGEKVLLLVYDKSAPKMIDPVTISGQYYDWGWSYDRLDTHGCGCCGGGDDFPKYWMPLLAAPK